MSFPFFFYILLYNKSNSMATSSTTVNIPKKAVKDFNFIKEIGTGSYSTVIKQLFYFENLSN